MMVGSTCQLSCWLRLGWPRFDSQQVRNLSLRHRVQIGSRAHRSSCSGKYQLFSEGKMANAWKHLYLVPRLRTRGVLPPLNPCDFTAWCLIIWTTFKFYFTWSPNCTSQNFSKTVYHPNTRYTRATTDITNIPPCDQYLTKSFMVLDSSKTRNVSSNPDHAMYEGASKSFRTDSITK
jgi:hypothetical protein